MRSVRSPRRPWHRQTAPRKGGGSFFAYCVANLRACAVGARGAPLPNARRGGPSPHPRGMAAGQRCGAGLYPHSATAAVAALSRPSPFGALRGLDSCRSASFAPAAAAPPRAVVTVRPAAPAAHRGALAACGVCPRAQLPPPCSALWLLARPGLPASRWGGRGLLFRRPVRVRLRCAAGRFFPARPPSAAPHFRRLSRLPPCPKTPCAPTLFAPVNSPEIVNRSPSGPPFA